MKRRLVLDEDGDYSLLKRGGEEEEREHALCRSGVLQLYKLPENQQVIWLCASKDKEQPHKNAYEISGDDTPQYYLNFGNTQMFLNEWDYDALIKYRWAWIEYDDE